MEVSRFEAARQLGCKVRWLHILIERGRLKAVRYDGANPFFDWDDVMRLKREYDSEKAGGPSIREGKAFYTGSQAARYLGITRSLFSYHVRSGHVTKDGVHGKRAIYKKGTLDAFAASRKESGLDESPHD